MFKKLETILIAALLFFFAETLFASITYAPPQPNIEQQVTFTASHLDGISASTVQWNFGDATSTYGLTTVTKIYRAIGVYTVRISYRTNKNQQISEETSIAVGENRRISFTPAYPSVNKPVTFKAENFLSTRILWNYADDTLPECKSTIVSHTYTRPGRYTVRAKDWCGDSIATISATIQIAQEEKGPRAAFQIYFIQLRFEDGKPY